MSTTIGVGSAVETAMLTLARFSLFFTCRKFLLRTLYSDLRSLSTTAAPGTPSLQHHPSSSDNLATLNFETSENDVELESLPLPTTYTPKSSRFFIEDTTYLHTAVSRIIFSWYLLSKYTSSEWRISLFILMSAILVVIPLSISLLLAIGSTDDWSLRSFIGPRAFLGVIPVALYLFALSYIPIPPSLEPSDTATAALSRLIFLPFGSRTQAVPSEQDIDTAQYALNSIRNDMRDRRAEAARREGSVTQESWFSRVGSSFRGSDSLTQELQGLEALEYQMSRNFEALRERREAAKFSSTFKGRIFNLVGKLFTAYCIIRIISSIYNVVFLLNAAHPRRRIQTLSRTCWHLFSRVLFVRGQDEDLASFARQLSLVLVGIIILSSIRLALRITSRNLAASLMLLVLAQIMGIYMISTIVQMRSSFPPPPPSPSKMKILRWK
ncbi:Abscisic acid G-protein coupled receptor-domain-containing protein [Flammula alnicola]|nr:Abscisic acid G-protein coupled receptor-domain-containing protein [Flammula alnicola]